MRGSGLLRFILAVLLIAVAAVLLQARSRIEIVPPRLPLSSFPTELLNWSSTEVIQDADTLAILGHGDFLSGSTRTQTANCLM